MLCMITTKNMNFPLRQLYSRLSFFINTKLVSSLNLYCKQYHLVIICCCICMDCFTKNHACTCKHHMLLFRDGGYANWWTQYLPTLINFKSTSFRWKFFHHFHILCWHVIIIVSLLHQSMMVKDESNEVFQVVKRSIEWHGDIWEFLYMCLMINHFVGGFSLFIIL